MPKILCAILFLGGVFVATESMADDSDCFPGVTGGTSMPYCCGDAGRKATPDQVWTKIVNNQLYIKSHNAMLSTGERSLPKSEWVEKCDALENQPCMKLLKNTGYLTKNAICQKSHSKDKKHEYDMYTVTSDGKTETITYNYICTAKECKNENGVMYFSGNFDYKTKTASNFSSAGICYDRRKFHDYCVASCHGCPVEGQTCLPDLIFADGPNAGKIVWTIPEYKADTAEDVYQMLTQQHEWKNIGWITAKCNCWDPRQGESRQEQITPTITTPEPEEEPNEQDTKISCADEFADFEPSEKREQRIKCCMAEKQGLAQWKPETQKCKCSGENMKWDPKTGECIIDETPDVPPSQSGETPIEQPTLKPKQIKCKWTETVNFSCSCGISYKDTATYYTIHDLDTEEEAKNYNEWLDEKKREIFCKELEDRKAKLIEEKSKLQADYCKKNCPKKTSINAFGIDKINTYDAEKERQRRISEARLKISEFTSGIDMSKKSAWKTAEGKFNTARLASDLTAGVVLGTVGGVVSGVVIKKKQVEKGFDALHCTVAGQPIADWGDTFNVGLRRY